MGGRRIPDFDVIVVGGGPSGAVSAVKCSKLGLNVLLMERGKRCRHKPCGGILPPVCADIISETLGKGIPRGVMCSPENLGLYYVPPSGRKNGGSVRNYRLLNVNRDLFDQWLCGLAQESGVQIWYEAEFLELKQSEPIRVSAKRDGATIKVTTRYLVGADGVYSRVRRQLYGEKNVETVPVFQEQWMAEGDFDDYFYAFFSGDISPTYAYVIPKDGLYVIGIGVPETSFKPISTCIDRFKGWLSEEFAFKPLTLERREVWPIPYGFVLEGIRNAILVGDAAGFCNALSGEGIRLAIESGVAAGNAVQDALSNDKHLAPIYACHVEWINSLVRTMHEFATSLMDDGREQFVKSELSRISFSQF